MNRKGREVLRIMKSDYLKKIAHEVAPKKYVVDVYYSPFFKAWIFSLISRDRSIGFSVKQYPGSILGLTEKIVRRMIWGKKRRLQ